MTVAVVECSQEEKFNDRTLQILNDGALALMISVGHRTGLFDTMATMAPASAREIADASQLNERYVREWLGAMVTGGIVDYDPDADTYELPSHRAACLTRSASPNNAVTSQWIAVLGGAEDAVVEAFHHGRGVPYSAYRRFHAVMADESRQRVVEGLTTHILPLVHGLMARMESGIDVLDIACGSGRAVMAMAAEFPASRFTGIDLSAEAIASGRAGVSERKLRNVALVLADAAELWLESTYHLITAFDAIHDQARPARVLARHLPGAPSGRRVPDAGRRRPHAARRQPVAPARAVQLHDFVHALHVGVAGRRRAGTWRDVGA